ncbi:MAG: type II CRISPR-associated endonuclease Cas1 [Candidatus Glassbacteria bacterium]|nr:type II CRISPR-associated endonuclease Cas1 [Candidatus Glassbacteria bacterium]
MSENRILLIENPAHLSVDHKRLKIAVKGEEARYVLPSDISVLVLHHPEVTLTVHALQRLAGAGASVLLTDASHMPAGQLWPSNGQSVMGKRLRQQIALEQTNDGEGLWRRIVRAKINAQAATLRWAERAGALRLERFARQVAPGDPKNIEAQAARHYWKHLFSPEFRRVRPNADDPQNTRLNYGYAVLRSLVARQLAASGLNPVLGLGHRQIDNPFNLADDFMEPYRHAVERQVVQADMEAEFDGQERVRGLAFLESEVRLSRGEFRLPNAIAESVDSYCRFLDGKSKSLDLPRF